MPAVKSTFSLDPDSIAKIQLLASKWQVPKTEVLRRAIREASARHGVLSPEERLAALHRLQKGLADQGVDFEKWKRETRRGRR